MAPVYETICQEQGWDVDQAQLARMSDANARRLQELEDRIKDAGVCVCVFGGELGRWMSQTCVHNCFSHRTLKCWSLSTSAPQPFLPAPEANLGEGTYAPLWPLPSSWPARPNCILSPNTRYFCINAVAKLADVDVREALVAMAK